MKRYLFAALLVALPASAQAQETDQAYCNRLASIASRYIGSAGGDGRMAPDLNILGAGTDCNKGKADTAIPYLQKRMRDNHITVPPRN